MGAGRLEPWALRVYGLEVEGHANRFYSWCVWSFLALSPGARHCRVGELGRRGEGSLRPARQSPSARRLVAGSVASLSRPVPASPLVREGAELPGALYSRIPGEVCLPRVFPLRPARGAPSEGERRPQPPGRQGRRTAQAEAELALARPLGDPSPGSQGPLGGTLCPDGEFAQEGWACRPAGEEGGDPPAGTADLFWSRQAP